MRVAAITLFLSTVLPSHQTLAEIKAEGKSDAEFYLGKPTRPNMLIPAQDNPELSIT